MFQSTHPHGVRPISLKKSWRIKSFNPRTHTGCDFFCLKFKPYVLCFNPRTHTGCDYNKNYRYDGEYVSIHAPTRGATSMSEDSSEVVMAVSIHAPTRGATFRVHRHSQILTVSIHAPTRGATRFQPARSRI